DPERGKTARIWAILCPRRRSGVAGRAFSKDRTTERVSVRLCPYSLDFTFSRRLDLTVSTVEAAVAAKEARRSLLSLTAVLVGSAVFTAAALGGLGAWLLLPAIVIGPGIGGVLLVWLALSSDANVLPAAASAEDVAVAEAA